MGEKTQEQEVQKLSKDDRYRSYIFARKFPQKKRLHRRVAHTSLQKCVKSELTSSNRMRVGGIFSDHVVLLT